MHTGSNTEIPKPLYSDEEIIAYVRTCNSHQAPMTFNVGIYQDGTMAPASVEQLRRLGMALGHKNPFLIDQQLPKFPDEKIERFGRHAQSGQGSPSTWLSKPAEVAEALDFCHNDYRFPDSEAATMICLI